MNPEAQHVYADDPKRAFFGDAPSLAQIDEAYGDNVSVAWLIAQLLDLGEYCGCRDKMTPRQAKECARIIRREFPGLKASEILLFFYRCKAGRYDEIFYGTVDPMRITLTIRRRFLAERAEEFARKEQEEDRERRSDPEAISFDEYCLQNGLPLGTTPAEIAMLRKNL